MKMIVSTKELTSVIKKAIALRCESFSYNPETKELVFSNDPELSIWLSTTKEPETEPQKFTFDTIQMFKVFTFLKELEEQPIVIKFNQYEDDKLSIELSQFVKRF